MEINKTQNVLKEINMTLHLPNLSEEVLYNCIVDYSSLNTHEIEELKDLAIEVFYGISTHIKDAELNNSKLINMYIRAYANIKNINTEKMVLTSKVLVFNFLKKINDDLLNQDNKIFKDLVKNIEGIFSELDSIRFVFRIKNEDKFLFPISDILFHVLLNDDLSNDDLTFICKIRIALEIFKTGEFEDKKQILTKLKDDYNIKLISYMCDMNHVILGGKEGWKTHLMKNKVICLVRNENEVYIRHPDRSYFDETILKEYNIDKVQVEKNNNGNDIAYFVEFKLSNRIQFTSIEKLLLDNKSELKLELLFLLFKRNIKNVFLEYSMYLDENQIHLLNPFCIHDKYFINSENAVKLNGSNSNDKIIKSLDKYYQNKLIGSGLDFMMVGSFVKLLSVNSNLEADSFTDFNGIESNVQNSVIIKWLNSLPREERLISFSEFINEFAKDTKYAKDYKIEIKNLKWFAFKLPLDEILKSILTDDEIRIVSNANVDNIKKIEKRGTIKYINESGELVEADNIIIDNDCDEGDCLLDQDKYYINSTLVNTHNLYKRIKSANQNLNTFDDYVKPGDLYRFKDLKDKMNLQKYALLSDGENFWDTDSIYNIRILNHLFVHEITIDKQEDFLKMILYHPTTNFEEGCKEIQYLFESNALVVPKEAIDTDSTLVRISEKQLKKNDIRCKSIFASHLKFENGVYCLKDKLNGKIEKIYFLFDTVLSGSQTVTNLKNYFPKKKSDFKNTKNRSLRYTCGGRIVTIKEIMEKNNIDEVTCVFINYANDCKWEGKINKFFDDINIKCNIKKCCPINVDDAKKKQIIELSQKIYGDSKTDDKFYPLIREFNMPKKTVFPEDSLNPKWISSIFVRKEEL